MITRTRSYPFSLPKHGKNATIFIYYRNWNTLGFKQFAHTKTLN